MFVFNSRGCFMLYLVYIPFLGELLMSYDKIFHATGLFAILDKAKLGTGYTRGLNLAAVKRTTVQVTRLPL
jgi:hypothetical protein